MGNTWGLVGGIFATVGQEIKINKFKQFLGPRDFENQIPQHIFIRQHVALPWLTTGIQYKVFE